MIRRRPFQLLALAASLAAAAPAAASEVPVSGPFTITTPFDVARSLASADFDRDGDLDLAAVGEIDDDVAWWENTAGDGSAWTRHDLNTDFDQPRDVAAGDLDGDGDPDVVATAFGADRVLWWENDLGSGAACGSDFCEHTVAVLAGADALRLADVDRDGDLDVVATARAGDDVVWLENSGDGSSWTRHTIDGAIDGPQFIWVDDLDGDGDPDVLAGAGEGGGELAWWENDLGSGAACGSDWCDHSLDTGNTLGVAAGDLDGDGDLDLLRSEPGSLAWWRNDAGDGSSWTEISIATDLARLGLAAVDVDGDGDLDVAGLATDGWLENVDGDAGTWTPRSFSSDEDLFDVELADLDGDGDLDFAAARSTADLLVWRRNETLHRSATYATGLNIGPTLGLAAQVAAGDVDGDGDPDLVATGEFGEVRWLENDGTPNDGGWTSRGIASGLGAPHGVAVADLDRDGDLDIAVCLFSDGDVLWFENDGSPADGGWTQHSVDGAFPSALRLAAADLDGDGDLDLLASSRSIDTVSWFENDGSPGDGEWTRRDIVTDLVFALGVAAADLDGDGDLDVLAAAGGSSDLVVWFENDGSPGDGGWIEHTLGAGFDGATELAACDLDGDGDLDVPAVAEDADVVAWFENDGTPANGAWTMHTIEGLLDRPRRVVCADFDADGDADVAATAYFANEVVVWRSDGSPADGGWQRVQVATGFAGASGLAAADLDRDGKPDFVATASLVDRVRWWRDGGGQLALPTTDRVVASNPNEGTADVLLLEIAGAHRGRAGDAGAELAALELLFEETAGDPLTGTELDALVDTVRLYLDDGDAAFEPDGDDLGFFSLGSPFSLTGGALTLTLVDGDPSVQMAVGSDLTWWLAVDLTANAGSAVPGTLRVTHVTASSAGASSTGEMATTDLPLALELQDDVSSSTLDVNSSPVLDAPIGPQLADTGVAFSLDGSGNFSDPEGGALTFAAGGLPGSLAISTAGVISGTPTVAEVAGSPYSVTVTASDPGGLSAMDSFTLGVELVSGTIAVDGVCTLADAILAANANADTGSCTGAGGVETLVLDADVTLTVADVASSSFIEGAYAGLPDVTSEMTIQAGAASTIARDGGLSCLEDAVDHFRLLHVRPGGRLTLDGLTLSNGCAARGGAIHLGTEASRGAGGAAGIGTLTIVDSVLSDNTAQGTSFETAGAGGGAEGSGIHSAEGGAIVVGDGGHLESVTGSLFQGNQARGAHDSGSGLAVRGYGGAIMARAGAVLGPFTGTDFVGNQAIGGDGELSGGVGSGGAIHTESALDLSDGIFSGNQAIGGDGGPAGDGGFADGGAVVITGPGVPSQIQRMIFAGNSAQGGTGDSAGGTGGHVAGGAVLGYGVSLTDVLVTATTASAGGGNWGGDVAGGALLQLAGSLERVTVSGTVAQGGDGIANRGGDVAGGAVFTAGGDADLRHVTISATAATGGASAGSSGGTVEGGAWLVDAGTVAASHLTVAANRATSGAGGTGPGTASSGGVSFTGESAQMTSSIVAGNTAAVGAGAPALADCAAAPGTLTSLGYNLVDAPGGCTFTATADQTGVDPQLAPLGEYGCAAPLPDGTCLPVHPVRVAGPALDRGSCAASGATADARGLGRPFDFPGAVNADDGCDAGAYEARDDNGNGADDALEIFADGFESGDTTAWSATTP